VVLIWADEDLIYSVVTLVWTRFLSVVQRLIPPQKPFVVTNLCYST